MNQDYYSVLGVDRRATEDQIKRAYRRLARQHHPDVNKGDRASEQRFKAVNEAYDVLGDAARRRDYDEFGSNWRHAEQLRSGPGTPFGGRRGHHRLLRSESQVDAASGAQVFLHVARIDCWQPANRRVHTGHRPSRTRRRTGRRCNNRVRERTATQTRDRTNTHRRTSYPNRLKPARASPRTSGNSRLASGIGRSGLVGLHIRNLRLRSNARLPHIPAV